MHIKNNRWACLALTLLILMPAISWAVPRTATQAHSIALNFVKENSIFVKCAEMNLNLVAYDRVATTTRGVVNDNPAYYIFNLDDNKGFIIVSGDDQAKEVLGYSDKGTINVDNMAPNLQYWLGFYEKQIKYILEHPTEITAAKTAEAPVGNREYALSVAPLLDKIEFNQGTPYNNLCPKDKNTGLTCVTGCVATAMASVMRYYKYPETGLGSHSYTPKNVGKPLKADFGDTKYDWDNILPTYNRVTNATDEQLDAIGTLMLHCGIALDMDYSSNESGTSQNHIVDALTSYFGYNPNMVMRTRDQYTYTEWFNMIKEELNSGRPICYAGQSKGGGHSFILDGYDTTGKVHFDWGWDGTSNGYYELNSINPNSTGVGGGDGAYNEMQCIILRLQPELLGKRESLFIVADNIKANRTSYSRDNEITITCNSIWNHTSNFEGGLGLALYTEDEQFVVCLGTLNSVFGWPNGSGYQSKQYSGTVPSSVSNGTYRLYVVSKDNNEEVPSKVLAPIKTFSYYTTVITDDKITLTAPEVANSEMELKQLTQVIPTAGYIAQNTPTTFTFQLTNTGLEYFKGEVGVYFRKKGGSTFQRMEGETYTVDYNDVVDVTVEGTFTKEPGTYIAVACYSENGGKNWEQFPLDKNGVEYEIYPTGLEETKAASFNVVKDGLNIVVNTANVSSPIEVFTASGEKILQQIPNGGSLCFIPASKGVYVVRQNEKSVKVIY